MFTWIATFPPLALKPPLYCIKMTLKGFSMKLLLLTLMSIFTLNACVADDQAKWLVLEFVNDHNEGTYAKIKFTESFFNKEKGKRSVSCFSTKTKNNPKTQYTWAGNTIMIRTSLNPSRGTESGVLSFDDLDTVYAFNAYKIESESGYKTHDMAILSEPNFRDMRRGNDKGSPDFESIPEVSVSKLKDIKIVNSFYCFMGNKEGKPVDP